MFQMSHLLGKLEFKVRDKVESRVEQDLRNHLVPKPQPLVTTETNKDLELRQAPEHAQAVIT